MKIYIFVNNVVTSKQQKEEDNNSKYKKYNRQGDRVKSTFDSQKEKYKYSYRCS